MANVLYETITNPVFIIFMGSGFVLVLFSGLLKQHDESF